MALSGTSEPQMCRLASDACNMTTLVLKSFVRQLWVLQECMTMYLDRAKHGFKGVKDVNVVCDASRHSVYDCLVSVFYTRQNDIAAYPPTQSLRSTKFVRPGEIACDSQVEKLLAEGSRTRLAGYRLLQAISHQLTLICDGLDLTSFMVPEAMAAVLKPLSSSVTRVVRGSSVRLVDTAKAAPSPTINLLDLCKLPILVLGIFGLFISFCVFLSLSTYLIHIYDTKDSKGVFLVGQWWIH